MSSTLQSIQQQILIHALAAFCLAGSAALAAPQEKAPGPDRAPVQRQDQIKKEIEKRKAQQDKAGEADDDQVNKEFEELKKEIEGELKAKEDIAAKAKTRMAELANELRTEFTNNQAKIRQIDAAIASAPDEVLSERLANLRRRQRVLKLYWDELATRGTDNGRSAMRENIDLMRKLSTFSGKVRGNAKMRRQVSDLQRKLFSPRVFGPRGNNADGPFKDAIAPDAELLFEFTSPGQSIAALDYPGFESGAMEQSRGEILQMLQLRWKDGRLLFDRNHWDVVFAGKSQNNIYNEVNQLLENKGIPIPKSNDIHRLGRTSQPANQPNIVAIFEKLAQRYHKGSSVGGSYRSSGKGYTISKNFSTTNLDGRLKVSNKHFEVQFVENVGLARILRIQSHTDGRLSIAFVGNGLLSITQEKNGAATLSQSNERDQIHWKANTFAELYAERSDHIDSIFFPLLRHLGVGTPATRFSPQTIARLLSRIRTSGNSVKATAEQLIADLDNDKFSVREGASKELKKNYENYREYIVEAVKDKTRLSVEAHTRLSTLHASQKRLTFESDTLIDAMGLLDDKFYLIEILTKLKDDEQQQLAGRLQQITGKSFGADVAAWKSWLAEQDQQGK